MSRELEVPFILEAYDYYPAFLPRLVRPAGRWWFNWLCRKADGCVAASHQLQREMARCNAETIVVENGYDPEVFKGLDRDTAMRRLGLDPARKYICFIGSATRQLGFGDLAEAMQVVRQKIPEATLLHAGYLDPVYSGIRDLISLGQRSQEEVALALSASLCAIVPYQDSLQVAYSNSCKLVEYMAVGIPVVATGTGDNQRILGEDYPGLVESGRPGMLAGAILEQLEHPVSPPDADPWRWETLGERLSVFMEDRIRV